MDKKIDARNFGSDSSVRPYVQTLGKGEGSPKATRRGRRMRSFLGGKSPGAFGQPVFFLAGNRMTIVPFENGNLIYVIRDVSLTFYLF